MLLRFHSLTARAVAAIALLAVPAAAQAQLFYTTPPFEAGIIDPGDPLVGEPLPGATADEAQAALTWNLRAGLNVAALRCQFSKYLRAVDVYNATLAHHEDELTSAYATLGSYFKRQHGQREGQKRLDAWNTRTYQNFSTPNSQGFCQTASSIGKDALSRPKGAFSDVARQRLRELRNSTRPYVDTIYPLGSALRPLPESLWVGPVCTGLTGRELQQCQQGTPAR